MVKSKFKNTDIGQIPEDWDLVNWNDVFDFKSTASYSRAEIKSSGDVGYIHYGDIHTKIKATLDVNKFVSGYISNKQLKTYTSIKKGDLIMADASEDLSGVGKSFEVIEPPKNLVISGLHTFLIREKKSGLLATGFKGYFHFNPLIKKQYDSLATGLKVYSLSKGSFQHIQIPLPPFDEQKAIAELLSDTDSRINNLENFIAKKSNFKQGAMQTLLTPKENWEIKKLGEITEIKKGKGLSKRILDVSGKFHCILYGELFTIYKEKIENVVSKTNYEDCIKSIYGDILFPGSTTTKGSDLAKSSTILKNDVLLGGDIIIVRKKNYQYNSIFLTYFLNVIKKVEIAQNTKGITIHHLYGNDLKDIEVMFPALEEQTQIATILTDLEDEIQNLEKKLQKAKQLKQGMMQQLLTGKIRLVNTLQTS